MIAEPHHDGSALHVEGRARALGDPVTVRLRVPEGHWGAESVWLRSLRDAEPHFDRAVPAGRAGGWAWWEARLRVLNPVQSYRWVLRAGGRSLHVNAAGLHQRDVPDAHDFRIAIDGPAPEWVPRSVMYQVFPDRFARSSAAGARPVPDWAIACDWDTTPVVGHGPETPYQFYGGDLDGVRERLDHIQGLGATVLYLTPVFPARSNHRYDAADFRAVDPLLGGDPALVRLVREAHARGLRVIGDLTTNHSGDAHEWFRAARDDAGAPEAGYYYFSPDHTNYVAWLGVESLPKFNWNSAALRRRFILDDESVVARMLRPPFDLDGWRIDVANMTGRMGADDLNREVALLVRDAVRRIKPDAMLLAEATSDAAPDFQGDTWHGAMTYTNFTRPLWQWLARGDAPDVPDPTAAQARVAAAGAAPAAEGKGDDGDAPPPHPADAAPGGHPRLHATGDLDAAGDPVDDDGPAAPGFGPAGGAWFFGLPQDGPDRIEAEEFLDTHRDFAAAFPWSVRRANVNAIDTHDTARAATAMLDGGQPVGVALQFMLPGIPMVFMGDEFGLRGTNGEESRTPMPWDDPGRVRDDLRPLYARMASLRAGHPALLEGGIRWLHAEGDVLVFVREHADACALVVASRAGFDGVELPVALVGAVPEGGPAPLGGVGGDIGATVRPDAAGDVVVLAGAGPAAAVFGLGGVERPPAVRGT